jgi:hypothetical protein
VDSNNLGDRMEQGPGVGIALAALVGIVWLALGALVYTVLAVGTYRRWGARSLWLFWGLSAAVLSALGLVRLSSRYTQHGGRPIDWLWGSIMVALIALATAGACLRVAQVGRRPERPTFARHTLAGCVGMALVAGALLIAFLVSDAKRLLE